MLVSTPDRECFAADFTFSLDSHDSIFLVENSIFGVFLPKVNKSQFLTTVVNWRFNMTDLESFPWLLSMKVSHR